MKSDKHLLAATVMAGIIFAVDITIPLGVAFGVFYVVVILITLQTPYRHAVISAAVISTVLVLLGLVFSPEGGEAWKIYFNRAIAIFAIWFISILGLVKKEKKELLHQSETKIREAQRIAKLGIFKINFLDSSVWWSEDLYNCLGFDKDEFVPAFDTFYKYIHVDDADRLRETIEKLRQSKSTEAMEIEYCMVAKNGGEFHVHTIITPGKDAAGQTISCMGVCQDITERKQVEKTLWEKEQFQNALLNDMLTFVGVLDSNGDVIFVNNTPLTISGLELEDVIGKKFFDAFWWAYSDEVQEIIKSDVEQCASGESIVHDVQIQTADGSLMWIEYSMHPIYDEHGDVQYLIPEGRDITERKQADEALQSSEERFRALFDNNPLMLFTIDETDKVLSVNQFGIDQLGYPKDQLVGKSVIDVFHEEDKPLAQEYLKKCFAEPERVHNWELRKIRQDGTIFYVHETVRVVDDIEGKPTALIVCEDITHKMEMEEQLRRSQKMEAIGQLAGGIAHDFNNLLGIIQSNFEFLQDFKIKDDNFQKWINTGLKAVKRGASLTRRLLSFSRAGAVGTETVYINELLTELKELFAKSLTPRITVDLNLGKNVWYVNIDTNEFQDALVNLALNARDAMPEGGTLRIVTSNKQLDENDIKFNPGLKTGNYVVVSVSDTGCGMDQETLDRVFEPFFSTKETGKGTGLGLSMVYGFAKRSKGLVNFYSEVGHGTTARLYLPMVDRREEERDESNAEEKAIPGGTEMILAVDDEIDILQGVKHRLKSLGYQVLTAGNGPEALEVINNHKGQIALLFSDVVMPGGMSGYELAQEVGKREPDIKILLASGFTSKIPKENFLLNTRLEVMEKPYSKMELATRLRELLDSC